MAASRPGADALKLGFAASASAVFDFLVTSYHFRQTVVSEGEVGYESDKVRLSVYHDQRSLEIGLEIGLIPAAAKSEPAIHVSQSGASIGRSVDEYRFSLDEVVALLRSGEREPKTFSTFACTVEQVEAALPQLAEGLREYGAELLAGSRTDFEELALRRTVAAQAFTRKMKAAQSREQADVAWRGRDFAAVVEHLTALGDALTSAEQRKLEYARSRLG